MNSHFGKLFYPPSHLPAGRVGPAPRALFEVKIIIPEIIMPAPLRKPCCQWYTFSIGRGIPGIFIVSKYEKLLVKVLSGSSDANIPFDELCQLLHWFGFEMRTRGSHYVFRKRGIEEKINLQRDGSKARAYQVRQVRAVILKYKMGGDCNG